MSLSFDLFPTRSWCLWSGLLPLLLLVLDGGFGGKTADLLNVRRSRFARFPAAQNFLGVFAFRFVS